MERVFLGLTLFLSGFFPKSNADQNFYYQVNRQSACRWSCGEQIGLSIKDTLTIFSANKNLFSRVNIKIIGPRGSSVFASQAGKLLYQFSLKESGRYMVEVKIVDDTVAYCRLFIVTKDL